MKTLVVYRCFIFSIIIAEILTCKKRCFFFLLNFVILVFYCFVHVLTQCQMFYPQTVIYYIIFVYAGCNTNTVSKLWSHRQTPTAIRWLRIMYVLYLPFWYDNIIKLTLDTSVLYLWFYNTIRANNGSNDYYSKSLKLISHEIRIWYELCT